MWRFSVSLGSKRLGNWRSSTPFRGLLRPRSPPPPHTHLTFESWTLDHGPYALDPPPSTLIL